MGFNDKTLPTDNRKLMRRLLNTTPCAWLPTAAVCGDATVMSSSAVTRLHRFQGQNSSQGRYIPKEPFTVGKKSKRTMLTERREWNPSVFSSCLIGISVALYVYFAVQASVNHLGKPPSQSQLFYRQRNAAQNRSNLDFTNVDLKFDPKKEG
jgi:hypothetical protein